MSTSEGYDSVPISMFADPEFAASNKEAFDRYVEYRVRGYGAGQTMSKVFGAEPMQADTYQRSERLEANPYYLARFEQRLKEIKIEELWNTKTSLHELLSMARSPFAKDSTRLNAIKELNIMVGIIVIDENGKTKAGRSLEDFYKDVPRFPNGGNQHVLPDTTSDK